MRTVAALFLLALVAGCSTPTAAPPPATWAFKGAVTGEKKEACDVSASQANPVLGDIQAFALEPQELWLPGYADKINWEARPLTPGVMDLELRRPGSDAVAYHMPRNTGPSVISFPEPGCWDLTVRTSAKSGTTRLYLEPARPVGLAAGEGAQIILQKSLVTGDCHDVNVPVAAAVTAELAGQIEKQLGRHWRLDDSEKQPWHRYDGGCSRFAKP